MRERVVWEHLINVREAVENKLLGLWVLWSQGWSRVMFSVVIK